MTYPHDPDRGAPEHAGPDDGTRRPAGPYPPPAWGMGWQPPGAQPPPAAQHQQPWGQPWGQPWAQPPAQPPGHPWPPGPPWPPPQWAGPLPEPPPRRRKRWPWISALLVLVVGFAVGVPLALRGTALDPHAVQQDVAAQYQLLRGGSVDLRCDQDMPVRVGRRYHCTGTTDAGGSVRITITVTGRGGAYTWSDRG